MNWVSVENKKILPEILENVLMTDGDRVYKGYRMPNFIGELECSHWYNDGDSLIEDVTHWMPLPELPNNAI
jgi:hypothetical protein